MELKKNSKLTASYPWMKDNRQQVEKVQKSIKTRLIKRDFHQAYIKEFEKAVRESTVVELSWKEIDNYTGPVNYNNHFEVINKKAPPPGSR